MIERLVEWNKHGSYNKDIQGSTTSLIKENGTADATYTYTDFGETTTSGSNTAKNEVCYTGGIYDSSTGQYYLNARYYTLTDEVCPVRSTMKHGMPLGVTQKMEDF